MFNNNPRQLTEFEKEADFGFQEISNILNIENTKMSASCLEIGCGPGILISKLKTKFPSLDLEGIEPFSRGFSSKDEYRNFDNKVHNVMYENFIPEKKYDLIYSINVLEHVKNWKHLLNYSFKHLKAGGKAVFLFPNYGFPYESHIGIPIIINKSITKIIFREKINTYMQNNGDLTFYDCLNFVKKGDIKKYLNSKEVDFKFDEKVIIRMKNRFEKDSHFADRQKHIKLLSKIADMLKIYSLIQLKLLNNFSPYSKLVIRK